MRLLPWEQLQEDVKKVLESIDTNVKISKGSGAVKGNGDVKSTNFMAECKLRSTDGYAINYETFKKIKEEASLLGKIPLLVNQNKSKNILITLTLTDFQKIIKYYENKNNTK